MHLEAKFLNSLSLSTIFCTAASSSTIDCLLFYLLHDNEPQYNQDQTISCGIMLMKSFSVQQQPHRAASIGFFFNTALVLSDIIIAEVVINFPWL